MKNLKQLKNWDGQSPPTFKHQKGKPVVLQHALGKVNCMQIFVKINNLITNVILINKYFMFQNIPYFGEYQKLREAKIAEIKAISNPLDNLVETTRSSPETITAIPSIKDVIGKALNYIGTYKDLNNKEQVIALIDDVRFNQFLFILIFIYVYLYNIYYYILCIKDK